MVTFKWNISNRLTTGGGGLLVGWSEFPSSGHLPEMGVCVRADTLSCVHSIARRHKSDRQKFSSIVNL